MTAGNKTMIKIAIQGEIVVRRTLGKRGTDCTKRAELSKMSLDKDKI